MIRQRGSRNHEDGFTLVELAIVMIIIGLLIGGILKGQELIANAQMTTTIAQIKGLDGALSTFRDKYSVLPGDITNPAVRLRDCGAGTSCTVGGDGNGRIDRDNGGNLRTLGRIVVPVSEGFTAFSHMAAADLISGIDIANGQVRFGSGLPEAKVGGGFWIGHTANGNEISAEVLALRPGHYLLLNGVSDRNAGNAAGGGMTASQAAQIDRKQDDGTPRTGDVQTVPANCIVGGIYDEQNVVVKCSVYIRVQG